MSSESNNGAPSSSDGRDEHGSARFPDIPAVWVRSAALSGILLLLALYTMYFAASLLIPIVLAFLLSLILSPIVRFLTWIHVPQTLAALVVMLAVATLMAAAVYALSVPATEWVKRAPTELRKLESKLAWAKEPIKQVQQAKQQVEKMTDVEADSDSGRGSAAAQNSEITPSPDAREAPAKDDQKTASDKAEEDSKSQQQSAEQGRPPSFSLVSMVLSNTTSVVYGLAVMLILLFFVLASGDAFLNKVVQVTTSLEKKKRVVETAREVQRHVAIYLGTITIINIAVGMAVALGMYLIGMPNPLLWGVMLTVLNYIPYLGVAMSMVVVTFVAMLTFANLGHILLPAAIIFAINVVEGQFLTPIITGRRLSLSPVAVFIAIAVLGWIWGLVGVLIAVPTLAVIKLVCERVEPLHNVATFLGRY